MVASQNGNGMIRLETSTSSFNFFRFDNLNLKSVNHSDSERWNFSWIFQFHIFNLLKSKQNKSLIDSWISARLSPTHAQPRLNSNILIFRGLNEERKSKHLKIKTSEFSLDWARALIQLSSSKHELTTWDSGSLTWTQKQ